MSLTIKKLMKLPYTVELVKDDEGFSVCIKELKGCMSCGDSVEEAMSNIEEAKESWLEAALSNELDIPMPESMVEKPSRH